MAKVFGTVTPSVGNGNKALNLGVSGITRIAIKAIVPGVAYVSRCVGKYVSGTQKYISEAEGWGALNAQNTFELIDPSTGAVVYQANVASIVGTTLNWNVTVSTIQPQLLLDGDDY